MKEHITTNPLYELESETTELFKITDMTELIVDAIFNGDNVSLINVGSSLEILLCQMQEKFDRIQRLSDELENRFMWVFEANEGNADKLYEENYFESLCKNWITETEKSLESLCKSWVTNAEQADIETNSNSLATIKLTLMQDNTEEQIKNLLKKSCMEERKRGFIEGYKAAVKRCIDGGPKNG